MIGFFCCARLASKSLPCGLTWNAPSVEWHCRQSRCWWQDTHPSRPRRAAAAVAQQPERLRIVEDGAQQTALRRLARLLVTAAAEHLRIVAVRALHAAVVGGRGMRNHEIRWMEAGARGRTVALLAEAGGVTGRALVAIRSRQSSVIARERGRGMRQRLAALHGYALRRRTGTRRQPCRHRRQSLAMAGGAALARMARRAGRDGCIPAVCHRKV